MYHNSSSLNLWIMDDLPSIVQPFNNFNIFSVVRSSFDWIVFKRRGDAVTNFFTSSYKQIRKLSLVECSALFGLFTSFSIVHTFV